MTILFVDQFVIMFILFEICFAILLNRVCNEMNLMFYIICRCYVLFFHIETNIIYSLISVIGYLESQKSWVKCYWFNYIQINVIHLKISL